jgi:hypothetical protein
MSLRELMIEYILFAFTEEQLMGKFSVLDSELEDLPDVDLLEIYDKTLLSEIEDAGTQF